MEIALQYCIIIEDVLGKCLPNRMCHDESSAYVSVLVFADGILEQGRTFFKILYFKRQPQPRFCNYLHSKIEMNSSLKLSIYQIYGS